QIPVDFWFTLGLGVIKSFAALIAAWLALRVLNYFVGHLSKWLQDIDIIAENDESISDFFKALKSNMNSAAWIAIAILCAHFLILPVTVTKYLYVLLRIYLIIAIGLLIFKVVAIGIDSLNSLSAKYSGPENLLFRLYDQLKHLIPFLKRCLEYIIYVLMATLVIQQIDFIADLANWGTVGVKLITIVLLSRVLISVLHLIIEESLLKTKNLTETQEQRRLTLVPIIQSISKYIIYFGSIIFMLDAIGIDPAPILAGAGILGLAVGFGAQNLINDIVSGFFILFENYYLVGDYIETNEASGYVEAIELRTTRIRHYHGQVHIIRNGDITSVTNYSKEFVYSPVNIGLDYGTDLDRVYKVIEAVGHQLRAQDNDVIGLTEVEGIDEFGEIRIVVRTKTKVKPGKHFLVQATLRKLLKDAFDREGIYIPIGETTAKPEWAIKANK
ncbi:MAG: mechanosensitive ion channel family protein, partial [Cyanobacteria bacterium P01_H01_bin.58]